MVDCPKPPPVFGAWLVCADGLAHHRLDGAMLCGTASRPTAAPLWRMVRGTNKLASYCPRCRQLNWTRWAKLGV